ncbi:MAG: FtsX-like permease family protein [Planctomycetota bacterium]
MADAYAWFLAWRYLWARRITLIGMGGVALAVWALIAVIAVFSGFIGEIRAGARRASPDLLLTEVKPECDFAVVAPILQRDPDVVAVAPRVHQDAVIAAYGRHARYVQATRPVETSPLSRNFVRVLGIDVAAETRASDLVACLQLRPEDSHLQVPDLEHPFDLPREDMERALRAASPDLRTPLVGKLDGLVMSVRRLTRGEPIERGSRIDVVAGRFVHSPDGGTEVGASRRPTVLTGAFACNHRIFDDVAVLADIEFVRGLLGYAADESDIELCTSVAIRVRPGADLDGVARRLAAAVHDVSGGRVLTWEEQNSTFLSAVDQERRMMKICLFAVMLVAGFLIYATLHMMVMQKVRDIGILTSMGGTGRGVQTIFLVGGLAIAGVGSAIGVVAGVASALYLNPINDFSRRTFGRELFPTDVYALNQIPYELDGRWIVQVVVAAIALALIVAWLPARRAARLNPVEALAKA